MTDQTSDTSVAMAFRGRTWVFGDNVPTDQIVATDIVFKPMEEVLKHVLEELKPEFPANVKPGDILVAGHHFGQSSGRAIAPKAIKACGISCIVAHSFARTFLRNCYEIGLPVMECPEVIGSSQDGDIVSVDLGAGTMVNERTGARLKARPVDPFLLTMLKAGGIIPLVKQYGEGLGVSHGPDR